MSLIPEKIKKLTEYEPACGDFILKLDANESPYTLSEATLDKFAGIIRSTDYNRYPDVFADDLCRAFAEKTGVDKSMVIAGNGSDELISVITASFLSKGDSITVLSPDFSMYGFYADICELSVYKFDRQDFSVDKLIDFIVKTNSKMLIFSNPCNPTGEGFGLDIISEIIGKLRILCVVDEAYMDFWDQSAMDLCQTHKNLIVLRTLSKAYGAAGLRLGFAVSDQTLTIAMKKSKSPYNVNVISQRFGEIIIKNEENRAAELHMLTVNLQNKLRKILIGAQFTDTKTNFIYCRYKHAKRLYDELLRRKIAIRYMGGYIIRISTGNPEQNQMLCGEIKRIVQIL